MSKRHITEIYEPPARRTCLWKPIPFWSLMMHKPALWDELVTDRSYWLSLLSTDVLDYFSNFHAVSVFNVFPTGFPKFFVFMRVSDGDAFRLSFHENKRSASHQQRDFCYTFCQSLYRVLPAQLFDELPTKQGISFRVGVQQKWIEEFLRDMLNPVEMSACKISNTTLLGIINKISLP